MPPSQLQIKVCNNVFRKAYHVKKPQVANSFREDKAITIFQNVKNEIKQETCLVAPNYLCLQCLEKNYYYDRMEICTYLKKRTVFMK